MKHIVWTLLLLYVGSTEVLAQCTEVPKAMLEQQNGLDALLISDYQVRLKEGTIKRPVRVRRIEVDLEANIKYRFTLYQPDSLSQEAVLQLYDHSELLATSYDRVAGTDLGQFEFVSEEDVTLQMVMSSKAGKRICATALFSMVLEDTTTVFDSRIGSLDEMPREVLYIGIDNPIKVAASGVSGGYLEVSVSDGEVNGAQGDYVVRVTKPGVVFVKVTSYERDGTLHEESVTPFIVQSIPDPVVNINGVTGGNITLFQLSSVRQPQLTLIPGLHKEGYEMVEFAFSRLVNSTQLYPSRGDQLSERQKQFLQGLQEGEEFYLRNVVIRTPGGELRDLPAVRFKVN